MTLGLLVPLLETAPFCYYYYFLLLLLYDIPTIYRPYERVLQNNLKCKLSIL